MNEFLATVERRAFRMARFASGNTDDALDLLQNAMLDFVRRYASRPAKEWSPLFYRVLQSRIIDWHRRNSVRKRFFSWLGRGKGKEEEKDIQDAPDPSGSNPFDDVKRKEKWTMLQKAIQKLPLRQQQAFLLRAWEEMDVAQAASAMGCSEGSIKTHYSRAVHTLRGLLKEIFHEG
jgi:RNA polymerase sigma-70 factor (ECF subfamily)